MRYLRGVAGGLIAIWLLGAAPAQAQHWFTIKSSEMVDLSSAWGKIMEGIYGPYDKRRKCWIYPDRAATECMRPHKLLRAADSGKDQFFVVTANKDDGNGCHACPGKMGLILFELDGDTYKIIANNSLFEEFGSWGAIPAEEMFSVDPVGPGKAGLSIEAGYMAQGYTETSKIVYAKFASSIVQLASVNIHADDEGTGKETVRNLDLLATFKPDPSKVFYDIELKPSPQNNVPVNGDLALVFDTETMSYLPNAALDAFRKGGQ